MDEPPRMPGRGELMKPLNLRLLGPGEEASPIQGGKPTLLLFFGSAGHPLCRAALATVAAHRDLFDDARAAFYGISVDPADERERRIAPVLPGIHFLLDFDGAVSRGFALLDADGGYAPCWLLLDRSARVAGQWFLPDGNAAMAALRALVAAPPGPDWAPVLLLPDVLEPELCRDLIVLHGRGDRRSSGVMREVGAQTRQVLDPAAKVRRDHSIANGPLALELGARLIRRVAPMIERAFQYRMEHLERLLIGCYDAEEGGHFRAHRDNTTRGTAHRQFAITINLNAGEYDGGLLSFPEFGRREYLVPTGSALVFSCSLLHQVAPVTRGRRYALLPFLFDDAGMALRERNRAAVDAAPITADQARAAVG